MRNLLPSCLMYLVVLAGQVVYIQDYYVDEYDCSDASIAQG